MRFVVVLLTAAAVACFALRPAEAEEFVYFANLSGASQAPPTGSPGTGTAYVIVDTTLSLLHVEVNFSGLLAPVTSAHIQGLTPFPGLGTAESATSLPTLSGFVPGVTTGFYHGILPLESEATYNPAFIAAHGGTINSAVEALKSGLSAGQTYFNIRTSGFEDGEIRGFLTNPPADLDLNGRVDRSDLRLILLTFGEATTFGDTDDDGDTDGADLLAWQRQFGSVAEIPPHHHHPVQPASTAVPEPTAAGLATFAAIAAITARRAIRRPIKKEPDQA